MVKIRFEKEIRDCQDCPCCEDEYGWGDTTTYRCSLVQDRGVRDGRNRIIAAQVEYRNEMPDVPKWCPIRYK